MIGRLAGRVAIVTGAGQGIGAAIATRLADDGAAVLVADLREDTAAATAEKIRQAGGSAAPVVVDVADHDSVLALPAAAARLLGTVPSIFVANAGVQTFQNAVDVSTGEWDLVMDVNARGMLYSLQAADAMPDGSSVVAVSSVQGRVGNPYYPHYSASKAAVLSLVRSFALALAPRIRVNAVAPGMVDTPLWGRAATELGRLTGVDPDEAREARIGQIPLRRAGRPEDVAAAVAFLVSDDADYITGETIHISGGAYSA